MSDLLWISCSMDDCSGEPIEVTKKPLEISVENMGLRLVNICWMMLREDKTWPNFLISYRRISLEYQVLEKQPDEVRKMLM